MDGRRILDLALALPALLVAAPAIALGAAAVKLTSPGPAFFVQRRVGRGRRPFSLYKLRSMRADGDADAAQVTARGDPRVTPVGRLLRAVKLDELPQLWNVVRGDMSLVGPRPEVERYVASYRPEWERVFSVRPGVTDGASIAFRDEEAILAGVADRERVYREVLLPTKLALALADVDDPSVAHALALLGRTALAVLGALPPHPAALAARREIERVHLDRASGGGARDAGAGADPGGAPAEKPVAP